MFGNRLGWGISAVIVLIAGYLVNLIVEAGRMSPPTGWVTRTVQPFDVPPNVASVVPIMTESADSADLYRQAIADATSHPDAYSHLSKLQNLDPKLIASRPGLKALLSATPQTSMDLFRSSPQQVVMYDPEKPAMAALAAVANAAKRVALLSGTGDPKLAVKYYASLFSLGVKLARERVVFDELSLGEELMGTGAAGMLSIATRAHDDVRVRAIKAFDEQRLSEYEAKITPVWKVVSSIEDAMIAQHAGDIFQLARDPQADLMWRVESTLKVGRIRYNADRRGDQVTARSVLRDMAADPKEPPAVQTAATAAKDLTIEAYRQLR